ANRSSFAAAASDWAAPSATTSASPTTTAPTSKNSAGSLSPLAAPASSYAMIADSFLLVIFGSRNTSTATVPFCCITKQVARDRGTKCVAKHCQRSKRKRRSHHAHDCAHGNRSGGFDCRDFVCRAGQRGPRLPQNLR